MENYRGYYRSYLGGFMSKKVKLIIEIVIFVCMLGIIGCVYYMNTGNKEEVL